MGGTEDAAKMRINRAVEKLRHFFTKHGVVLSAAALTATLAANSVQAAPATLGKKATSLLLRWPKACGRQHINRNPHQRSIETYGLGKSKNRRCCCLSDRTSHRRRHRTVVVNEITDPNCRRHRTLVGR